MTTIGQAIGLLREKLRQYVELQLEVFKMKKACGRKHKNYSDNRRPEKCTSIALSLLISLLILNFQIGTQVWQIKLSNFC